MRERKIDVEINIKNIEKEDIVKILNSLTYNDFRNINFEIYPAVKTINWDRTIRYLVRDLTKGTQQEMAAAVAVALMIFQKIERMR